jgi:hypothetical protein
MLVNISLMTLFLPAQLRDYRFAISNTILLILIFSQLGYLEELAPKPYLSYLKWLYIYANLVAAVVFGLFCWSTHRFSRVDGSEQQAKVTEQIERLNSLFQSLADSTLVLLLVWMLQL